MARAAFITFRSGLPDGVSVVTATWVRAFRDLGFDVWVIGGEGVVDRCIDWLTVEPGREPDRADVVAAVACADLVVVENVLTIPVNLPASLAVAAAVRGRRALLHHHDPPWQRPRFADVTILPADDPAWRHVTINRFTEREFAARGLRATTIYNGVDLPVGDGDRVATRRRLGVAEDERLALHPVRAIERKNVPGALALAEAVGATYWLPGPAEEGYGPTLDTILASARTRVLRQPVAPSEMAGAYAACDVVLYPSHWEGFGLPPMEAAGYYKPVVVGHYPVGEELRGLGFRWLDPDDVAGLEAAFRAPDPEMLTANAALARRWCSYEAMREAIRALMDAEGWLPGRSSS